ncbi:MAG: hypothetical protein KDC05_12145 [Bacteroidales bacterium]|nr:hypothetical protein [Bacteroidales bacterium]
MDREANISTAENTVMTVSELLTDKIKSLTGPETERYLSVSSAFREEIETYSKKVKGANDESSMSLFLFESLNTSSNLLKIMEEKVEEKPDPRHFETLDSLKTDLPPLTGIMDSNNDQQALFNLAALFRKKERANLLPYFAFSEVVTDTLEKSRDPLNVYYKSISDLLLHLWESSNVIAREVNRLADGDLSEKTIQHNFDLQGICQSILSFEETLKKSEAELHAFVRNESAQKQLDIDENRLPVPDPVNKNRLIYNRRNILDRFDKTVLAYKSMMSRWHNTFHVLSDDWMLELEIAHLKYFILKQHYDFAGHIVNRFIGPINENLGKLESMVSETEALFGTEENKDESFDGVEIDKKRTEVKRKLLLRMVPETRKITLESDIPSKIDAFERNAAGQFKQLSEVRAIKENTEYNRPTETKELDRISPRSLVSFQMMPHFMERFPQLKQSFIRHLQEVQNRMEEIPDIIDYSLNSALSFFEEKKDTNEARKIGMEGLKRAGNKTSDLKELINNFYTGETATLKSHIEKLTQDLTEITNNESALQIKMRITRARAIEKSKELRARIFKYIKDILPRIGRILRYAFRFLRESSIRISKQFIAEDRKRFIATDVSDYLTETEQAINLLPFIYQRLFKTEPLTSFELYTDRSDEIEKLKKAYARWKEGKFAPTVIIAEKGWGKTTLVNRFLKMKLTHEEVIHIQPEQDPTVESFFKTLMEKVPPVDQTNKTNEGETKKRIVVLDGLEKLFEARINGFDHLLKLLQHLSDTNNSVFWLTTCHLHAWEYLDKTIGISDFFGYHVRLTDMTDETLMKTIDRRHNISGYRLMFLPEEQKKSLISFKKQVDFGDQEELRKQYFTRMHRIVKGNLSQAFLFWMRSTAKVTEDAVYIEYISNDMFNFLGSMNDSKLMILKNIVIHNGITAAKHAGLFRIDQARSHLLLQQLHDDGIIVSSGNVYNINPIIYRQVIDHLYLLNILH